MSESKGDNKYQVFIGQIGENGWLGVDELLSLKCIIDILLENLIVDPDTDPETKDLIITTLERIKN